MSVSRRSKSPFSIARDGRAAGGDFRDAVAAPAQQFADQKRIDRIVLGQKNLQTGCGRGFGRRQGERRRPQVVAAGCGGRLRRRDRGGFRPLRLDGACGLRGCGTAGFASPGRDSMLRQRCFAHRLDQIAGKAHGAQIVQPRRGQRASPAPASGMDRIGLASADRARCRCRHRPGRRRSCPPGGRRGKLMPSPPWAAICRLRPSRSSLVAADDGDALAAQRRGRRDRPACTTMAGTVNQKIDRRSPAPGSMPISPPMASTRRLEIARPRPEPPNLRAWLESAWTNSWKISWRFCERHAHAGVAHFDAQEIAVTALGHLQCDADAAFFGELDGIAHQIGEDLAQADLVDADRVAARRAPTTVTISMSLACARGPRSSTTPSTRARTSTSSSSRVSVPDSILEKSRMSPIRISSASPDWVIASA